MALASMRKGRLHALVAALLLAAGVAQGQIDSTLGSVLGTGKTLIRKLAQVPKLFPW